MHAPVYCPQRVAGRTAGRGLDIAGALGAQHPAAHDHRRVAGRDAHLLGGRPASRGRALMRTAMNQLQLPARAYHRVLKLSRTIAYVAGSEAIQPQHLAEALQYRLKTLVG